ncbi:hypothetical protein [Pilimelia columellifera]|uniref:Uncharacterized protein n=1 Tax=Pilimelia columellifera subsp. columellifera TaxID=706583 RepID=A0ABP6AI76_9ACTN
MEPQARLRVTVAAAGERPIGCELVDLSRQRSLWTMRFAPADFGIGPEMSPYGMLRVPGELRREIVAAVTRQLPGMSALWLHLVAPYGWLSAAPWESVLAPRLGIPVLRLPRPLPAAAAPAARWTVAVVANAPAGAIWPTGYLPAFARALTTAVRMPAQVDVFADAATADALSRGRTTPALVVHEPPAMAVDGTAADRWSRWLTGRLAGTGVRVLYVIGDGALDGVRSLTAVAADPGGRYRLGRAGYLSGGDIRRLADRLGAPAVGIGSPPGNDSDLATRLLADAVGSAQCGPTAYVDIADDREGRGMAAAQAFLANPPGSTALPIAPALFVYVQPTLLAAALGAAAAGGLSPGDQVEQPYAARGEQIPGWVAASARYLDFALVDRAVKGGAEAVAMTRGAYEHGQSRGLSFVHELVAAQGEQDGQR